MLPSHVCRFKTCKNCGSKHGVVKDKGHCTLLRDRRSRLSGKPAVRSTQHLRHPSPLRATKGLRLHRKSSCPPFVNPTATAAACIGSSGGFTPVPWPRRCTARTRWQPIRRPPAPFPDSTAPGRRAWRFPIYALPASPANTSSRRRPRRRQTRRHQPGRQGCQPAQDNASPRRGRKPSQKASSKRELVSEQ